VKPHGSIFNQFDTTKQDIAEAKTLDELLTLYRPALENKRAADKKSNGKDEYRRYMEEPTKASCKSARQSGVGNASPRIGRATFLLVGRPYFCVDWGGHLSARESMAGHVSRGSVDSSITATA